MTTIINLWFAKDAKPHETISFVSSAKPERFGVKSSFYSSSLVSICKSFPNARYSGETKTWFLDEANREAVEARIRGLFATEIADYEKAEAERAAKQAEQVVSSAVEIVPVPAEDPEEAKIRREIERITKAKAAVAAARERIETRIRDLDFEVAGYSYRSKSHVKYELARERSRLRYALDALDKPVAELLEIDVRTLAAVANEYGD